MTPLASNCVDRFLDALDLGESAVRRLDASLAFVGEYSTVASIGYSFDLFERRSTSIATIGIDARMTPGTWFGFELCCASICGGIFGAFFPAFGFGFIPRLFVVGEQVENSRKAGRP